jgi:hypothetical protein
MRERGSITVARTDRWRKPMHAMVVTVTINDREGAVSHVRDNVVPAVSQLPGFVAGYWIALGPEKGGRSIVVFESEETARSTADQLQPPPGGELTIESIDVGEVVVHA